MHPLVWSVAAPAIGAAFLASLVEATEAFTLVLAAASLGGARPAAVGAAARAARAGGRR
jgi:Ca2+/H+ antiporter, TMEM165/GDT1 family